MKPALLILDPQNDFFASDNPNLSEFQATVPIINAAVALFRTQNWPIVFIQHTSKNKAAGTYAWAIYADIYCSPEDTRLSKAYANAFWKTKLDFILKSARVDFVVVTGFLAEHCVLSTFRGARERGYRGAILQGATASLNDQYTKFVLEISPCITLEELRMEVNLESHAGISNP
jgi:nicotinamidase-related amidase